MLKNIKRTIRDIGSKIIYRFIDLKFLSEITNDINNRKIISECESQTNLGENSKFYPEAKVYNSQLKESIVIGDNTNICGQLLVFKYGGRIKIGNDCYVGGGSRIWSGESVIIGNNVLISHNVSIVDTNSHEVNHLERAERYKELAINGPWQNKGSIITNPILISDYVWINFGAIILKGVTIGEGAIVAAGAVVTKDVESFTVVAGNPAVVVRHLNNTNLC